MKSNQRALLPASESVWDYPRPPRVEAIDWHLKIIQQGRVLAETNAAVRVLETSHPPCYYLPMSDVDMSRLERNSRATFCEWKGKAEYWDLVDAEQPVTANCGWSYPDPVQHQLRDRISFYASRVDQCFVEDERVQAQEGDFYGGWITGWLNGPFKGAPGTLGW